MFRVVLACWPLVLEAGTVVDCMTAKSVCLSQGDCGRAPSCSKTLLDWGMEGVTDLTALRPEREKVWKTAIENVNDSLLPPLSACPIPEGFTDDSGIMQNLFKEFPQFKRIMIIVEKDFHRTLSLQGSPLLPRARRVAACYIHAHLPGDSVYTEGFNLMFAVLIQQGWLTDEEVYQAFHVYMTRVHSVPFLHNNAVVPGLITNRLLQVVGITDIQIPAMANRLISVSGASMNAGLAARLFDVGFTVGFQGLVAVYLALFEEVDRQVRLDSFSDYTEGFVQLWNGDKLVEIFQSADTNLFSKARDWLLTRSKEIARLAAVNRNWVETLEWVDQGRGDTEVFDRELEWRRGLAGLADPSVTVFESLDGIRVASLTSDQQAVMSQLCVDVCEKHANYRLIIGLLVSRGWEAFARLAITILNHRPPKISDADVLTIVTHLIQRVFAVVADREADRPNLDLLVRIAEWNSESASLRAVDVLLAAGPAGLLALREVVREASFRVDARAEDRTAAWRLELVDLFQKVVWMVRTRHTEFEEFVFGAPTSAFVIRGTDGICTAETVSVADRVVWDNRHPLAVLAYMQGDLEYSACSLANPSGGGDIHLLAPRISLFCTATAMYLSCPFLVKGELREVTRKFERSSSDFRLSCPENDMRWWGSNPVVAECEAAAGALAAFDAAVGDLATLSTFREELEVGAVRLHIGLRKTKAEQLIAPPGHLRVPFGTLDRCAEVVQGPLQVDRVVDLQETNPRACTRPEKFASFSPILDEFLLSVTSHNTARYQFVACSFKPKAGGIDSSDVISILRIRARASSMFGLKKTELDLPHSACLAAGSVYLGLADLTRAPPSVTGFYQRGFWERPFISDDFRQVAKLSTGKGVQVKSRGCILALQSYDRDLSETEIESLVPALTASTCQVQPGLVEPLIARQVSLVVEPMQVCESGTVSLICIYAGRGPYVVSRKSPQDPKTDCWNMPDADALRADIAECDRLISLYVAAIEAGEAERP